LTLSGPGVRIAPNAKPSAGPCASVSGAPAQPRSKGVSLVASIYPPLAAPGGTRRINYFKRFRMEDRPGVGPPRAGASEGYAWVPWEEALRRAARRGLVLQLQRRDRRRRCFRAWATARAARADERNPPQARLPAGGDLAAACHEGCCAPSRGLRERAGLGAIQNIGITLGATGAAASVPPSCCKPCTLPPRRTGTGVPRSHRPERSSGPPLPPPRFSPPQNRYKAVEATVR